MEVTLLQVSSPLGVIAFQVLTGLTDFFLKLRFSLVPDNTLGYND